MSEIQTNYHQLAASYFESRGWQIVNLTPSEANLVGVRKNNPIRCADDRYPEHQTFYAPAFFGGIDGIAALYKNIPNVQDRFERAVRIVEKSGFTPAGHGDEHQGEILGCGFRKAWIDGKFEGLPSFTELEAQTVRYLHKIYHIILEGIHTAQGLLLNLEDNSTVTPEGKYLVNDLWYPLSLDFPIENILDLAVRSGELILPEQQQKLFLIT